MCLVMNQGLLRESPDSRLPDVAGPAAVLATAATSLAVRGRWHRATAAVTATVWLTSIGAAAVHGRALQQLAASNLLSGPRAVATQWTAVDRMLHLRPIDWYAPPGSVGLGALTRYLFDCTAPSDRVLVGWFAPEVPFLAERLFAGGHTFVDPGGWNSSPGDQELAIARLQTERVPVVLMDSRWEREVRLRLPRLFAYIDAEYEEEARSPYGDTHDFVVLTSKHLRPVRRYEPAGLPCYR
jgi:hypothetical protein